MEVVDERSLKPCPCGSELSYATCCMLFHHGKARIKTAEQLMRSRYSAYFFRRVEYLVETTHPKTRDPKLTKQIGKMIHNISWQKLTVLATSKGGPDDNTGKVEFIADYRYEGEMHQLHELSRFRKFKGSWKYLDGKSDS